LLVSRERATYTIAHELCGTGEYQGIFRARGVPARRPALSEWLGPGALSRIAVLPLAAFVVAAALAASPLQAQEARLVDRVVVLKSRRLLELLHQGRVIKSYPIDLGRDPLGPKLRQGDNRTPEGIYRIDRRQAVSRYHLALHISYPSAADAARARSQQLDPGGAVFIHGFPPGFDLADPAAFQKDWTAGCIAVSNRAIEEIWREVADGTVVEIRP
jgi:murein L,D-transpeptidase YafK